MVYGKGTLVLYRKGICVFSVLGFAQKKVMWEKHCEYFGPDGVPYIEGAKKCSFDCMCNQSEWFILGLISSTATILQYTNVTVPNQRGSSWD